MHNESLDSFWRQEVHLVVVKLSEKINLHAAFSLFIGQLSQLDEEHETEEGQLLVLMMEYEQGQQVFLQEVPLSESGADEGILLTVKLQVLEQLLKTLFRMLVLDIDIKTTNLFNRAHSLDPKE